MIVEKEILNDWQYKRLGEVCEVITGTTPSKKELDNYGDEIPFIKPPQLVDKPVFDAPEKLSFKGAKKARVVPLNTVFVSCIGNLGKTGISKKEVAFNQQLNAILENENISGTYIFYLAQSPNFKKQLENLSAATTVAIVNKSKFETIQIPIAPCLEQQRIVSKIEELFSELDKGIEQLKTARQQLKVYRQSVLKWAFEGKLTNENIQEGELPKGWDEKEIKDVCENIKVGIVIKPSAFYSKDENGIKAFRSANVREFRINDSDWVYFTEEANEINYRTKLKEGDVLLVRSGYPGTSCIVSKKFEGTNAIDVLIATPNKERITAEYLCCFNNSPLGKGMFKSKSRGVAQKHLNVGEYSRLKINFPSLEEQKQIVQEIESRLSVADKLEETINSSLQQAEALRQSILKKAFEGKLV